MDVVRDLFGGFLVIIGAGVIAIAQNSIREDKIPLIPKSPASVSEKPYTHPEGSAEPAVPHTETGGVPTGGETPSSVPTPEELAVGEISRERVKQLVEGGGVVLIDARPPQEYRAGHIAGAINVPYESLSEHYESLTRSVPFDATIVCYCQSVTCDESENLARELRFMGYSKVILYKGGWDDWSQVDYPAESITTSE